MLLFHCQSWFDVIINHVGAHKHCSNPRGDIFVRKLDSGTESFIKSSSHICYTHGTRQMPGSQSGPCAWIHEPGARSFLLFYFLKNTKWDSGFEEQHLFKLDSEPFAAEFEAKHQSVKASIASAWSVWQTVWQVRGGTGVCVGWGGGQSMQSMALQMKGGNAMEGKRLRYYNWRHVKSSYT